jgi:transcriptional regulator with XRE-family HTH domain
MDEIDALNAELSDVQLMLVELSRVILASLSNKRRVTDKSIAKIIGIHNATYSSYVNGIRVPELFNALRIADAIERYMGIDKRVEWLRMLGIPDYVVVDPEDRILLRLFEKAPADARKVIRQILADPKSIYDTWTPDK